MNDRLSASWVLIVGTVFIAYWYYKVKGKAPAQVAGSRQPDSTGGAHDPSGAKGSVLDRILALGQQFGFPTPSVGQTTGGKHATNSLHYVGRAVDFGTRGISDAVQSAFIAAAKAAGFRVLDERYTGEGPYGPSSGPHLHVDLPFMRSDLPGDPEGQLSRDTG